MLFQLSSISWPFIVPVGFFFAADAGWPHSPLLNASKMENNLVNEVPSKSTHPPLLTAPGFLPPDNTFNQQYQNLDNSQLSGLDRPLKIELDDACSKR